MIVSVYWRHLEGSNDKEFDVLPMNSHPYAGNIIIHPNRTSLYQVVVSTDLRGCGYGSDAEIHAWELPGTDGTTEGVADYYYGTPRPIIYKSPVPDWAKNS